MGNTTSYFDDDSTHPLPSVTSDHFSEDGCEDSPSHDAWAKAVSDTYLNYLRSFSAEDQDHALGVTGLTPSERVKMIICNDGHDNPGRFLTNEEIALAVRDCYTEIMMARVTTITSANSSLPLLTDRSRGSILRERD